MAEPPPSGTGQQDKSYFKNSVAKDGKVTAFAKAAAGGAKKAADHVQTEVKLSRQYEGACPPATHSCARRARVGRLRPRIIFIVACVVELRV